MNQQDFDLRLQKTLLCRAFAWAFGAHPLPVREQPRGNHSSVVDNDELVASQDFRELRKLMIFVAARDSVDNQHPRGFPIRQRLLGDQLRRQLIIEVVQKHLSHRNTTSRVTEAV